MVLNSDVVIFNRIFYVGKFLGVVPVESKIWNKIIPIVYILTYTSIVVASISGRFVTFYKYKEIKVIIMEMLQTCSQYFFIITFIYGSFRNHKKWNFILKFVNNFDKPNNYNNVSKFKLVIPNVATIVVFVVISCLDGIYNYYLIYYRINSYSSVYYLYLQLFVFNIAHLMCRRIRILNKTLKNTISKKFYTYIELQRELTSFTMIFTRFGNMVKNINIVLGWSIFFYLPYSVINFLNLLDVVVSKSYTCFGGIFAYTSFSFLYIVSDKILI